MFWCCGVCLCGVHLGLDDMGASEGWGEGMSSSSSTGLRGGVVSPRAVSGITLITGLVECVVWIGFVVFGGRGFIWSGSGRMPLTDVL